MGQGDAQRIGAGPGARLSRYGPNVPEEAHPPQTWTVLPHQFTSPLIAERRSLFRVLPLENRFLFGAVAGALAVHLAALHLPFTRFVLRAEPLPLATWAQIAGTAEANPWSASA